jgi:acyl-CoA synthetase (NDP forming)
VRSAGQVHAEYSRMINLPGVTAILIQKMISGMELFCGAKKEGRFGHLVMAGMGGIFIEVFRDVATCLVPVTEKEAASMVYSLRSYKVMKGLRGSRRIDEKEFMRVITSVSELLTEAPEIYEMDINPLLGTENAIVAVDARISIEHGTRSMGHGAWGVE